MTIQQRIMPDEPHGVFGDQKTDARSAETLQLIKEGLAADAMPQKPSICLDAKTNVLSCLPEKYVETHKDAAANVLGTAVLTSVEQKHVSTEEISKKIKRAIRDGNTQELEKLAQEAKNITSLRDAHEQNLLHLAFQGDSDQLIENINYLCMLGCDVNAMDKNGLSPLYLCIERDHTEAAAVLFDHGADMYAKNKNGDTPYDLVHYKSQGMRDLVYERKKTDQDQSWILNPMQGLGYQIDKKGMCFGISHMAIHAVLANDLKSFSERALKMRSLDIDSLNSNIQSKSKAEKQERADILAFCDGISLYHQPDKHQPFLEHRAFTQNALLTSKEIAPIDLMKKEGAIVQADKKSNLFSKDELKLYFEKMSESFKDSALPIAIGLSANSHRICAGYFPDKNEWCLFDVNKPPVHIIKDLNNLTANVFESFFAKNDSHIILRSEIYTTEQNQAVAEQCIHQLQNQTTAITEVTEDKAQMSTQSGKTWLGEAAANGDLKAVQTLLKNKADVNRANDDGTTALFMAAQNGHFEIVKLLLKNNANVNLADSSGVTPLYKAAQNGHFEIAKVLLEKNAEVDLADSSGASPLLMAAQNGHLETVNLLLEKNADIDKSINGATPLFLAAQNGHLDIVKVLLGKNAQVNLADENGVTPLYTAAQNGHLEIVKLLLEKCDVDKADENGITALFVAAESGNVEIVKVLLEKNANPNKAKIDSATPLLVAAQNGHAEIAKLLLANKSDVNKAFQDAITPLYLAVANNHLETVKLLLEKDADINKEGFNDLTPLMQAVANGNLAMVELLLTKNPDINKEIPDGQTAMQIAYDNRDNGDVYGEILDILERAAG